MTSDSHIVSAPSQATDNFFNEAPPCTMPDLEILLEAPLKTIETIIYQEFQHQRLPILESVSHHIIHSGGKRIRPLLCVAIAVLSGKITNSILTTAAAIEFIHTATLLHDDVIDNGDARRGKKTAHLIWGNQAAILVGDHMFARAFSMLAETENFAAIKMMSSAAKMLAEGEIIQLSLKQKIPSFQEHIEIISNKTAALFASGCACGAILNNNSANLIQNAYHFGFNFGISFQLIDDILDYQGNDALGKKIGTDFFEGKFTLPLILAYNSASDDDKNFIKSVMFKKTDRSDDDFKQIKTIITKLDTIAQSRAIAKDYIIYAEKSLDVFDTKNPVYNALKNIIIKNLYRHL